MEIFWKSGTDGAFTTASNWQTDQVAPVNQVPGPNDIAVMTAPGSYTVQDGSGDTETVLGFTTGAGTTFEIGAETNFTATEGTANGANAGEVDLLNSYLTITDGTLNNTGSIGVNITTGTTSRLIFAGSVNLIGGGAINLTDDESQLDVDTQLTNVNNTIQGTGTIFVGSELVEDSVAKIDANDSGDTLTLEGEGGVIDNNHSFLYATNNGTLDIQGLTVNDASGGGIEADGGTVEIGGGMIPVTPTVVVGGSLSSPSGGVITLETGAVLDGGGTHPINNLATLGIADNATVTMAGTINNDGAFGGAIDMNSTGDPTILTVGDGTDTVLTLQGSGDVVISNTVENFIEPEAGNFKTPIELINVNNDISGGGFIFSGLTVDNEKDGVIDGVGIRALVDNAGVLENVDLEGSVTNTSTGVITAGTGAIALLSGSVTGGTLKSTGTGTIIDEGGTLKNLTNTAPLELEELATFAGTIKNTGSIASQNVIPVDLTLAGSSFTLTGTGTFLMPIETTITGATASTVFDNDGNTIDGEGLMDNLILYNTAGQIDASEASPLVIDTGTHAISNAALMLAGDGATLYLASPLDNTGTLTANNGTIFADQAVSGGVGLIYAAGEIEFAAAANTSVKFESGSNGMLVLADPTQYTGTISGFGDTQRIDLAGIAPSADLESFSGGILTIKGGAGEIVRLHFSGSYTLGEFSLTSDGGGGSILTDPPAVGMPSSTPVANVALLGSYMASMFASAEGQVITHVTDTAQSAAAALAHPHTG